MQSAGREAYVLREDGKKLDAGLSCDSRAGGGSERVCSTSKQLHTSRPRLPATLWSIKIAETRKLKAKDVVGHGALKHRAFQLRRRANNRWLEDVGWTRYTCSQAHSSLGLLKLLHVL